MLTKSFRFEISLFLLRLWGSIDVIVLYINGLLKNYRNLCVGKVIVCVLLGDCNDQILGLRIGQ